MKAGCLSFDWVTKVIQISIQTMEQKLVQRCETKVDADACKASYPWFVHNIFAAMGKLDGVGPVDNRPSTD